MAKLKNLLGILALSSIIFLAGCDNSADNKTDGYHKSGKETKQYGKKSATKAKKDVKKVSKEAPKEVKKMEEEVAK